MCFSEASLRVHRPFPIVSECPHHHPYVYILYRLGLVVKPLGRQAEASLHGCIGARASSNAVNYLHEFEAALTGHALNRRT